ncbi:hypothetical protein N7491_006811 [Penicillium cf. griseofulvum]|nr:hypothetical protein N7491_006811 [Penicillium cf. griseofulvum]
MPLERSTDPLVWIDCEMTGLNPETDKIIQICCFITDAQLNLLEPTGFETVINVPDSTLDAMSQWCIDTHGRTGLTAAVRASTTSPPPPQTLSSPTSASTVHADKAFLARAPYSQVLDHLHYRILDVSSLKEAARRWGSDKMLEQVPAKREVHLARDDILESIEEIRFYKEKLFG